MTSITLVGRVVAIHNCLPVDADRLIPRLAIVGVNGAGEPAYLLALAHQVPKELKVGMAILANVRAGFFEVELVDAQTQIRFSVGPDQKITVLDKNVADLLGLLMKLPDSGDANVKPAMTVEEAAVILAEHRGSVWMPGDQRAA